MSMPSIYLSRLLLNAHASSIASVLADAQRLHAWVLSAFPAVSGPIKARQAHGILFRVEELHDPHHWVRTLVQSHTMPDWSHIPERGVLRAPDERGNPAVREIGALYARIDPGQLFRFRLRASPTKSVEMVPFAGPESRVRSKRVPLLDANEQLAWLQRQGDRLGFHLAHSAVLENGTIYGVKYNDDRSTTAITHRAVLFDGILEVVDRTRFQGALRDGVGRGKGYGLGLLSVAQLLPENR
jgi:CRISPR system Cascade subunit CasE